MENPPDADLLRCPRDGVIDLPDPEQLQRQHPVAQVVEHEDQVVVVLEGLDLHPWDGLFRDLVWLILEQPRDLVLHEPGQLHIELGVCLPDAGDQAAEALLVEFGQFGEAIIRQQIRQFLGLGGVVLIIDGNLLATQQQRRLQTPMAPNNQPAALAHRDRCTPSLVPDDRREQLDLSRAMLVRVGRVGLKCRRINQGRVRAVDGHDAGGVSTLVSVALIFCEG